MAAKVAAATNYFASVPLVLGSLGLAQFGVWATLVATMSLGGFLDFGLANGAMNAAAKRHGKGDNTGARAIYGHVMPRALAFSAVVLAGSALALPTVTWSTALGAQAALEAQCLLGALAVAVALALTAPLGLATRIQLGVNQGRNVFRWQVFAQLLTLSAIYVLSQSGASLWMFVAVSCLIPLIASAANTYELLLRLPKPVRSPLDPELARDISRESPLFFVLQVSAVLAFSMDVPLISHMRGSNEAGTYAVAQRLFSIIPLGLSLLWTPLWPLYRQSLASGQAHWARKIFRLTFALAVASAGLIASVLVIGYPFISEQWTATVISTSGTLLTGMAVWSVVEAGGTATATFLNAAGALRPQAVIALVLAPACILSKALLLTHYTSDLVPWTTALIYVVVCAIPLWILFPRITATH